MSLSRWDEGSDSDHVTGRNWDIWLVGDCKILAWQWAKLPRYGREGAVEVRPFTAKKRLIVSEAQGLSGEAMKGNPTTTVIPGVDESKPSPRNNRRLDRTFERLTRNVLSMLLFRLPLSLHRSRSWAFGAFGECPQPLRGSLFSRQECRLRVCRTC